MRFYSPTCFRVTKTPGRSEFVAEPRLWHCVQSWLSRWNRFAPSQLFFNRERLLDFVEACGQLRTARVETKMMDFGKYPQREFVSSVEWALPCERRAWFDGLRAEDLLREIDALASFAFFCGTGYHTAMVLGQSRRVDGLERKGAKAQSVIATGLHSLNPMRRSTTPSQSEFDGGVSPDCGGLVERRDAPSGN